MQTKRCLFPTSRLTRIDYLIGGIVLLFSYFSFQQADLYLIGWSALNYLFGNPLHFYDNCKHFMSLDTSTAAGYPPTTFAIFAAWLYPFKLFGIIKSPAYLPIYLVYWLKLLTSVVYILTGLCFYKITQLYNQNPTWGKYATWLWLSTPLALVSQFIVAQTDIFYVYLTLVGFFYFLKHRIYLSSFLFGLAITFKYFPLFVFLPMLLLVEKKILRLMLCGVIFSIPVLLVKMMYGHSPAFIEGVLHFYVLPRIFSSAIDAVDVKIYYLVLGFAVLLGICYALNIKRKDLAAISAYIFLVSSSLPFILMLWGPSWIIYITPAIVLTTLLQPKEKISKLLLFDLAALLVYIGYISGFVDNTDAAMFQAQLFHIAFSNHYKLASIFYFLRQYSFNFYFSLFSAYLILQWIIKFPRQIMLKTNLICDQVSYRNVRIRYYFTFFLYISLVMFVVYKNSTHQSIESIRSDNPFCMQSLDDLSYGKHYIFRCPILSQMALFFYMTRQGEHVVQSEGTYDGHALTGKAENALRRKVTARSTQKKPLIRHGRKTNWSHNG
jgi:hypothetical protein